MQKLFSLVNIAKAEMALVINGYTLEKLHPFQSPLTQNGNPNTFQTFVFKLSLLKDFDDDGKRKDFLVSLKGAMTGENALMLVGIPSLTAIGAFAIDAGRSQGVNFTVLRVRADQTADSGPVDLKTTLSGKTIPAQRQRIKDALKQREDLSAARSAIPTRNSETPAASDRDLDTTSANSRGFSLNSIRSNTISTT